MADKVTPDERSRMMSAVRGADTKPELFVKHALHVNGFRFRLEGHVLIEEDLRGRFGIREHLLGLTVYFEPRDDRVTVGDTFKFRIGLQDDAMPAPVWTHEVIIRIREPAAPREPKPKGERPQKKAGPGGKSGGDGDENAPTHGLPKCVLLTRDGEEVKGYNVEKWPDDLSEQDGGLIQDLGDDGVIYKINYHNAYHVKYRDQHHGQVAKDVVTEKYILGMRILMLGFEHAYRVMISSAADKDTVNEVIDQFRRMTARGAASTVLALAENLPKIVDKSAIAQEDE
jgi:hypothetical protein